MTLKRVAIPSPNHGSARTTQQLLVVHTSEGAQTFRSLGSFLANPSAKVSYHVGFDNTTSVAIGEFVAPPLKSWSAHSANSRGEHGCCCTPSGASKNWTRADWLNRPLMLEACRQWLREESRRYSIPLVKLSGQDIRNGKRGVCGHRDCVAAGLGGTHTDPGANFPWDIVLEQHVAAPEEDMPLNAADKQWIYGAFTDILRKEGVSGATQGTHSSVDEAVVAKLGPKLDQIIALLNK